MGRWSLASPLVAVVIGCTAPPGELASEHPPPAQRRLIVAQALQIELPEVAGPEPPSPGPALFVTPTEVALERGDGRLEREVVRLADALSGDPLLGALYEALERERAAPGLDIFVDRRVPLPIVARVLYTASRGEWHDLRLIGGTTAGLGGLRVEASPLCALHPEPKPPFDRIRADLALEWGVDGVLATARPRPADREPFAMSFEAPPPNDDDDVPTSATTRGFPEAVPLRVAAGPGPQDALDLPALRRLAAELCAFNDGPTGLVLAPLASTGYAELLAVADAFAEPRCRGPRQLALRDTPRTPAAAGVAVAQLREHVLARANEPPR